MISDNTTVITSVHDQKKCKVKSDGRSTLTDDNSNTYQAAFHEHFSIPKTPRSVASACRITNLISEDFKKVTELLS